MLQHCMGTEGPPADAILDAICDTVVAGAPLDEATFSIVEVRTLGGAAMSKDAGQSWRWPLPYPCHTLMHGAGRYGLQCLTNLDRLPPTGSLFVAAPLKIREASGSPLRVLAMH